MSQLRSMKFLLILAVAGLIISSLAACSTSGSSVSSTNAAENPISQRETLTQVSTINALMAGVYDGTISCGSLKGYGDFGIGTFEAVDGEMVLLDSQIYQVKSDGVAYIAPDSEMVPFAAVTFFDSDSENKLEQIQDYAGLQTALDKLLPSLNNFYAVEITGTFSYVKTRSVPEQSKPYPPLTEVTKNQSVFEFNNVSGTIVGFRCPQYVDGVNVPGYHLHFLAEDRKAGGHLLELQAENLNVKLDYTSGFYMMLPEDLSNDFYKINLSGDQSSDLEKVEK